MNWGILLFPVIWIRRTVRGEGHSAPSRHLLASARLWQARPPAEPAHHRETLRRGGRAGGADERDSWVVLLQNT
jgi:hypothetical protein